MKRSNPGSPPAARRASARVAGALVALVTLSGCAMAGGHPGFPDPRGDVQIVSGVVGGKNVYVPSTIVLTDEGTRTLSIYNGTETIHGFAIQELGVAVELPPQKEFRLELPALEAHRIYEIHCQLHGAHRRATLVVLPGR